MIIGRNLTARSIVLNKNRKSYSVVTISIGALDIARANLGGKYSETDAINEFKRNPKRFTPVGDADLVSYAKVV